MCNIVNEPWVESQALFRQKAVVFVGKFIEQPRCLQ